MIHILGPVFTSRHKYVFHLVFKVLLGVEYRYSIANTKDDVTRLLNDHEAFIGYGIVDDDRILTMFESTVLNEVTAVSQIMSVDFQSGYPKYYYLPENTLIDFDIFTAIFHLITEYDMYDLPVHDKHGRYRESEYDAIWFGHFKMPLVNIYTEYLWERLIEKYPFLPPRPEKKFSWEITIDVDEPWAFLNKGIYGLGGFVRDWLTGNKENLALRKKAFKTGKDPYYSFDELFEILPPENTTFFFLINGKSVYDSHFTSRNLKYRNLIHKIYQRGYKTGIHPSYFSYLEPEIIAREKRALERILKKKVTASRQHFLKYYLPYTYEYLEEAGITEDYTSCPIHSTGFRNFTACPFPFYNIRTRRITGITIYPAMVMDTTLIKYMKLEPDAAIANIKEFIDLTAKYKGRFIMIWHNSNYTDSFGRGPWKRVLQETVAYLKEITGNLS